MIDADNSGISHVDTLPSHNAKVQEVRFNIIRISRHSCLPSHTRHLFIAPAGPCAGGTSVMSASRRLQTVVGQVDDQQVVSAGDVQRAHCSAAPSELLQNVDPHKLALFIDDQRELKSTMFNIFKQRSELLVPTIEGLSKTEHRQLVRDALRAILSAGFSPMQYFDTDIKKYIYMAEICAPVDLSLVRLYVLQSEHCQPDTL
jgi:hypothetical protein